jgi:hypothetical protein
MQNRKQIKIFPPFKTPQRSSAVIDQACKKWVADDIKRVYTNNPTFQLEH